MVFFQLYILLVKWLHEFCFDLKPWRYHHIRHRAAICRTPRRQERDTVPAAFTYKRHDESKLPRSCKLCGMWTQDSCILGGSSTIANLPVYSFLSWILEAWFAVYSPSRARACSSGLFAALLSNDTPVLTIYPWSTVAGELQAEGKVEIVICSDIKYVIAAAVDIWNDASVVFSWYAWMCGTGWTPRGP